MEDIGGRRLAGLIPRPLSRPARAGKFDQPMRPALAAHSHEATRHLVASRALKPFHDVHTTLELDKLTISNRNLRAPRGGRVLASNPVRNGHDR